MPRNLLQLALGLGVDFQQRVVGVVRQGLVELVVVLFLEGALGLAPQCRGRVDLGRLRRFCFLFPSSVLFRSIHLSGPVFP